VKRVLITGATGFIGRPVAEAMSRAGHDVHTIRRPLGARPLPVGVTGHGGDILDADGVRGLLGELRPHLLVHLAWVTDHPTYWSDPSNRQWRDASVRLFRDFLDAGGQSGLAAGTSAEYDWDSEAPLDEEGSAFKPRMLYGECKHAAFLAGAALFAARGAPFAWARFFCPFGAGEDARRLIPRTCLRLLDGGRLRFDAATQVRDFLHVEDAARAVAALAESGASGAVNIASGEPRAVRDVIAEIARQLGAEDRVELGVEPPPVPSPPRVSASIERLQRLTGWQAAASFSERIAQTCEWWKGHRPSSTP